MKTTHTPGPWVLHEGQDYISFYSSRDKSIFGNILCCPEYVRADARLATASPEILSVLKAILRTAKNKGHYIDLYASPELFKKAKKAIAKAEGK